ncbi:hypothetical protein KC887_06165, partial [Candidatus Kaiserbacteria bacterium]|nr:hypothetical protein [Candidatus Kaiserbacteria bacterium]
MKQVGEIVTHVSKELNDQRPNRAFTRWGRGFLLECLNLGLAEIGAYRTEAFCVLTDITLIPGGTQYVNNNITIAAITANSDGTPIRKADNNVDIGYAAYAKNETQCAGDEYKVRTYSVDTKNTHVFYVNPPCPKGATVTVKASLFSGIPIYGPEDW